MTKNPVLTISLLCSGREETKGCLDSLETLRKRVSSELILVDTGCNAEIKKVLAAYADEIVPFVWCDDFSKARNAGLEKAKGEWFLYMDDDESFIDTKAVEEFFLSGEYKNYGYAVYTVRNFFNEERTKYQDAPVARLYSLKGKGRFQGTVHENFRPRMKPVKVLSSIAEHTGYLYKTPEDKKKHAARNITLLERAISEESGDTVNAIHFRAHLALEYHSLKDYEKLLTFCKETLDRFERQEGNEINRHRGCFYCGEILAEMSLGEEEAALHTYERAISDKRNTGYCVAYLMTQGAELFWKRGEKEKTAECCRRYLECWDYYRERPEKLFEEQTFFVITAFYDEMKSRMYSRQISLDLKKGETASLRKYFDLFGWNREVVYMTEEFMPCLVKAMAEFPYDETFVHAADVLANKPGMDNFWEEIEKTEDEAGVRQIVRIFSEVTGGTAGETAIKLKKMLQAEKEDDWERFSAALKEAVGICPLFGETLKRYAETYARHRMEYHRNVEIQALAAQIKAQVPVLLSQGMKQEALQVLGQLRTFVPDDVELAELEKQIIG